MMKLPFALALVVTGPPANEQAPEVGVVDSAPETDRAEADEPSIQPEEAVRSLTSQQRRDLLERHRAGEALNERERALVEALVEVGVRRADSSLEYQSGRIELGDGLARIDLSDDFRFLGPDDARRVIEKAWGNPPEAGVLGLVVPRDVSPMNLKRGWGVVVTYVADGHVEEDAGELDADALMARLQRLAEKASTRRESGGYPPLGLVGWAWSPRYDRDRHTLSWAQHVRIGGDETLNYSMRVLGRGGVLYLDAVARMGQLETVRPQLEELAESVAFSDGNRYEDFVPGQDAEASYALTGLVLGKRGTKSGVDFGNPAFLAAGFGLLAVGGLLFGRVRRRRRGGTATSEPARAPG